MQEKFDKNIQNALTKLINLNITKNAQQILLEFLIYQRSKIKCYVYIVRQSAGNNNVK